jgi:hypothetical protein
MEQNWAVDSNAAPLCELELRFDARAVTFCHLKRDALPRFTASFSGTGYAPIHRREEICQVDSEGLRYSNTLYHRSYRSLFPTTLRPRVAAGRARRHGILSRPLAPHPLGSLTPFWHHPACCTAARFFISWARHLRCALANNPEWSKGFFQNTLLPCP